MSDVNLSDFKQLYISTAKEYIQKMETNIDALFHTPALPGAIEEVHISAHSLKSQSLVMGYQTTGELAHVIEIIFRKAHDEKSQVTDAILQEVQKAINGLRQSETQIEEKGDEVDLSQNIHELRKVATITTA